MSLVRSSPRHSGFTLIELLVVVGVVAILLAILLPSLRAARNQARRVNCAANQREILKAWHMYLDDHNGYFWRAVNADINFGGQRGLSVFYAVPKPLNAYFDLPLQTTEAPVFRCPDDRGDNEDPTPVVERFGSSYRANEMLSGQSQVLVRADDACAASREEINRRFLRLRGLKREQVTSDHSQLVLMGDYGWVSDLFYIPTTTSDWHQRLSHHNMGFLDGHVAFVKVRRALVHQPEYTTIPFRDLLADFDECQQDNVP